jgi:hypothetical protein
MFASEKYKYTADQTFKVYSFVSYGPKGPIHKIAKFNELSANTYNFGFGDYDAKTGNRLAVLFTILLMSFQKHK